MKNNSVKTKLSANQISRIESGQKISTKGLTGKAKTVAKDYNKTVDNYAATNPLVQEGTNLLKDLTKKQRKQLSDEQKDALRNGEKVSLKGVTNKKLKNQLKAYNKSVKANAKGTQTESLEELADVAEVSAVDLSDIMADIQQGTQAFIDAADEAMAAAE